MDPYGILIIVTQYFKNRPLLDMLSLSTFSKRFFFLIWVSVVGLTACCRHKYFNVRRKSSELFSSPCFEYPSYRKICCKYNWCYQCKRDRWSQLPHILNRGSAVALLRRLRVRNPPGTWMSVSCDCSALWDKGFCVGFDHSSRGVHNWSKPFFLPGPGYLASAFYPNTGDMGYEDQVASLVQGWTRLISGNIRGRFRVVHVQQWLYVKLYRWVEHSVQIMTLQWLNIQ